MGFYVRVIIWFVLTCSLTLGVVRMAKAEHPKCKLYEPYRCIPAYGNKVICGCGY